MKKALLPLPPPMTNADVKRLFHVLESGGKQVRFVGGCVRDALLGQVPADIDIVTQATPDGVIKALKAANIHVVPTGLKHGTVTAVINHKPYEITTLRRDVACYGRHAEVEFTEDFEEDARRRDFTFNAMSCTKEGELYDYFHGHEDLEKGIVRFVGDPFARVVEDYLRILRFFRFFARYGKKPMDTRALAAIAAHAVSLETLSGERIQNEMFKLLPHMKDTHVLEVMHDTNVLPHIALPVHGFVPLSQLMMLEQHEGIASELLTRLACLLRTSTEQASLGRKLASRWKLSNEDKALLMDLVKCSGQVTEKTSVKEQKKYIRAWGREIFTQAVLVAWAEFLTHTKTAQEGLSTAFATMLRFAETWEIPDFPIRGQDILSLGIAPGEQVGVLLREAEAWWEEKDYAPSHGEILHYVKGLLKNNIM